MPPLSCTVYSLRTANSSSWCIATSASGNSAARSIFEAVTGSLFLVEEVNSVRHEHLTIISGILVLAVPIPNCGGGKQRAAIVMRNGSSGAMRWAPTVSE
eukprot:scaffold2122_cov69-Phaeocystis_antarctica.AAC.9